MFRSLYSELLGEVFEYQNYRVLVEFDYRIVVVELQLS